MHLSSLDDEIEYLCRTKSFIPSIYGGKGIGVTPGIPREGFIWSEVI